MLCKEAEATVTGAQHTSSVLFFGKLTPMGNFRGLWPTEGSVSEVIGWPLWLGKHMFTPVSSWSTFCTANFPAGNRHHTSRLYFICTHIPPLVGWPSIVSWPPPLYSPSWIFVSWPPPFTRQASFAP